MHTISTPSELFSTAPEIGNLFGVPSHRVGSEIRLQIHIASS